MRGNLEEMSLTDLVQVVCSERKTALISLHRGAHLGEIWAEKGELVHAATGGLSGKPALFELFGWGSGMSELVVGRVAPARTLGQSWPELLLEAAEHTDLRARTPQRSAQAEVGTEGTSAVARGEWLRLAGMSEVRACMVARADGAVELRHGDADPEQMAALAVVVRESAATVGDLLGFGASAQRIDIETAQGRLVVAASESRIAAALLDPTAATEVVREGLAACLR